MDRIKASDVFVAKLAAFALCASALVFYVTKFVVFPLNGDFAIMAEVARRLSCGAKLYVETCDQKGPVMYLVWAAIWRLMPSYEAFWRTIVVFETLGTLACVGITAKVFLHLDRPRAFCLWCVIYALFGGPHVACADSWALLFSMYALWVVAEDDDGVEHGIWRYVVIGVLVSVIFWSKWACCVAFLVPLAYGLCNEASRRRVLVGGCIAFLTFFVFSLVTVLVTSYFGIFDAMLYEYFGAGGTGYVSNMALGLMSKGSDSIVVRTIPYILISIALLVWSLRKNRMPIPVLGACALCLLYSCMVIVVIYYRYCGFVAIAVCLLHSESDILTGLSIDNLLSGVVSGCLVYAIISVGFAIYDVSTTREYDAFVNTVKEMCDGDKSVTCTNSSGIDVMARIGLSSRYRYPSPYNVVHTRYDVDSDISAGRWHYVVGCFSETSVGDTWSCVSVDLRALAVGPSSLVLFECDDVSDDALLCDTYMLPIDS